ncbi:MAG: hypothetical protein ACOCXP_04465 [Candidatus Dojkabacteria bacterium]
MAEVFKPPLVERVARGYREKTRENLLNHWNNGQVCPHLETNMNLGLFLVVRKGYNLVNTQGAIVARYRYANLYSNLHGYASVKILDYNHFGALAGHPQVALFVSRSNQLYVASYVRQSDQSSILVPARIINQTNKYSWGDDDYYYPFKEKGDLLQPLVKSAYPYDDLPPKSIEDVLPYL